MNSSAAIKAFCGRNEGVVCTSSNAIPLFDIYLKEFDKMFFFPDQHLGRNTGAKFGIPLEKMVLWNPHIELGGNTEEQLREAKLILWRGHCSVHGRFKDWHVDKVRDEVPGVQVLVHPECPREVVEKSDLDGSTSFIIKTVENSPARLKMGDRDRGESRQPTPAAIPRQRHSPARPRPLHVRHDVPHRPPKPRLGDGESDRRQHRQRDRRRRRDKTLGERCSEADDLADREELATNATRDKSDR